MVWRIKRGVKKIFHFRITNTCKLVDAIAHETTLSKSAIKQALQKGAVWRENALGVHRIRRADKPVTANDTIHVYYDEQILALAPPTPTLIADEKDYSVWDKPRGMLSQGSKWSDHCTLHRWIETHHRFVENLQRRCYVVHRLDKQTKGLMFIAHKKQTAHVFSQLFENKKIVKRYYAIVSGEVPERFNQSPQAPAKPLLIESDIAGKYAKTSLVRLGFDKQRQQSLVDIHIETGRKHQIRIHCAALGFPIVGDRKYATLETDEPMQLQCYQLGFDSVNDYPARCYKNPLALNWQQFQ